MKIKFEDLIYEPLLKGVFNLKDITIFYGKEVNTLSNFAVYFNLITEISPKPKILEKNFDLIFIINHRYIVNSNFLTKCNNDSFDDFKILKSIRNINFTNSKISSLETHINWLYNSGYVNERTLILFDLSCCNLPPVTLAEIIKKIIDLQEQFKCKIMITTYSSDAMHAIIGLLNHKNNIDYNFVIIEQNPKKEYLEFMFKNLNKDPIEIFQHMSLLFEFIFNNSQT